MGKIHHPLEQIRRPVRLEEWFDPATLRVDSVLIGIEQIEGLSLSRRSHLLQRMGGKQIILIHKGDEITATGPDGIIRRGGNATIGSVGEEQNTSIFGSNTFQETGQCGLMGAIIA
jgi:hypothetical protein